MSRTPAAPSAADLQQAPAQMPDGPNVAPSLHEHEAAQGMTTPESDTAANQPQQQQQAQDGRDERIRQAAYALWAARGFEPGHEVEDWLQAERSLDGGNPAG